MNPLLFRPRPLNGSPSCASEGCLPAAQLCGRSPSPGSGASAFTLVELLVAIVVFGLVVSILYGTWTLVLRGNESALKLAGEAQRTRMAARTIEDALVSAVYFSQNPSHYSFNVDTSGKFAALSFVGHLGESFPGSGYFDGERVRRVTFLVESGKEGKSELKLYQNSMLAAGLEQDQGLYPLILARDVSQFTLDFFDPQKGEWLQEWIHTNQLPRIVRVTLGIGHGPRGSTVPDELICRIIRLPAVGVFGQ